jgi:uncharacterized membrane-anchored protein YhcB (DUF1043 family)
MIWILIGVIAVFLLVALLLGLAIRDLSERLEASERARKTLDADLDALQRRFDDQERVMVQFMHHNVA